MVGGKIKSPIYKGEGNFLRLIKKMQNKEY